MTEIEPHPELLDRVTLVDAIEAARTLLAIIAELEEAAEGGTDKTVELTILVYDVEDMLARLEALKP